LYFLADKILIDKGLFVLKVSTEERNCSWEGKEGLGAKEVVGKAMGNV